MKLLATKTRKQEVTQHEKT